MNLVEKLLKADVKTADEKETKTFPSRRLQKILSIRSGTKKYFKI